MSFVLNDIIKQNSAVLYHMQSLPERVLDLRFELSANVAAQEFGRAVERLVGRAVVRLAGRAVHVVQAVP